MKTVDQQNSHSKQGSALEVLVVFLRLGLTSFGGPVAHIGYFRKAFVEERRWLSEKQFAELLAVCQFLPGPASSQLGFAIGLQRGGWLGAICAFLAFTLPSAILLVLFAIYITTLSTSFNETIIHALKLVACVVVADAVFNMGKNLCPDLKRRILALLAALCLIVFNAAYTQIIVLCLAGFIGLLLFKQAPQQNSAATFVSYGPRLGAVFIAVFFILLALTFFESNALEPRIAKIFYQAGALVFGGGHVVLPLLEESIVASKLMSEEVFMAGYGASQAIPGPMFSFAAYLGALLDSNNPIEFGLLALLFMFLPGFILLVGVLPIWQSISTKPAVAAMVTSINAAVVGILLAALYDPVLTTAIRSLMDFIIVSIGIGILTYLKRSPLWVVLLCILTSIAASVF